MVNLTVPKVAFVLHLNERTNVIIIRLPSHILAIFKLIYEISVIQYRI